MPDKTPKDQERINNGLEAIADIFNKELKVSTFEIYAKVLNPYSVKQIEDVLFHWMNSYDDDKYKYFPKPNELVELIEKTVSRKRDIAKINQALIPLHSLSEEQIEERLRAMKDWKEKNLPNLLKRIEGQRPLNSSERAERRIKLQRQAEGLQEDIDNERKIPGDSGTG